jgi:hypothetical protein
LAWGPFTAHLKRTDRYFTAPFAGVVHVTDEKWARDSAGRTYSEDRPESQVGDGLPHGIYSAQITDPVARTITSWDSLKKEAVVFHMPEPRRPGEVPSRSSDAGKLDDPLPDKCEDRSWQKAEALGTKTIKGLTVVGKRVTSCVLANTDKGWPRRITVSEFWDAAGLGIPVLNSLNDPYVDSFTDEMTGIEFGEPDPALFQIPAGYTIRDQYPNQQN